MIFKSKIKWVALMGLIISSFSLMVHLLLANFSNVSTAKYSSTSSVDGFSRDFVLNSEIPGVGHKRLWGVVKRLESLQPYANPRANYFAPRRESNGFIYAKVFGGFADIRSSICDLVTISRLLNASLVIPEIQSSIRSKGISSKFKSFSYLYNEEQFISSLKSDVLIVKSLPGRFKAARKMHEFPTFMPTNSASPRFYIEEVLPKLKKFLVIGLILNSGGCLQSILPPKLAEYQRLRCRVSFHALHFRPEIQVLGHQIIERLRAGGRPFLAFHPALLRDTLAYHGCAELFQDVHTELIQYRRAQMIKRHIINEKLSVDSHLRQKNGSCPIMPEEVGILLRAMGYPPRTIIYVAGTETFGGQRVLTPLRAMFPNLVDSSTVCTKQELHDLLGPESPIPPPHLLQSPSSKTKEQLEEEWKKGGPRPRPLPPPPGRPIYRHEKEGWYGWIGETGIEPEPLPFDVRMRAHRLVWEALDYIVSVEADAFFPGFDNDGSGRPDFSGLVMGHRLYSTASSRTFRPDRKIISQLFNDEEAKYRLPRNRNWTIAIREHLNQSLGKDGMIRHYLFSKPSWFLSHPLPECSCRIPSSERENEEARSRDGRLLFGGEDECPDWMRSGVFGSRHEDQNDDTEMGDEYGEDAAVERQRDESSYEGGMSRSNGFLWSDQDDEMDPND